MKNLFFNEWNRTWSRKKTYIVMIGLLIYILFRAAQFIFSKDAVGHYNATGDIVSLHAMNITPFLLSEVYFSLALFGIPLILMESFSEEYHSGAYRLILIRSYSFLQFYMSKMAVAVILLLAPLLLAFILGIIGGWLWLPDVETVTFYYKDAAILNGTEAYWYNVMFLGSMIALTMTLIGICSMISIFVPNTIIAYLCYFGFLVLSFYIYDSFMMFILGGRALFEWFALNQYANFFFLGICFFVSYALSLVLWLKRDYVK